MAEKKNEIITFSESNIQKIEKLEALLESLKYDVVSTKEFTEAYVKLLDFNKEADSLKKAIDSKLKEIIGENYEMTGVQSVETEDCKITYVPGGMKESFDSKKFAEDHPDLYQQYLKVSTVSPSLRVTLKKSE